jgi:hypothetical protein
MQLPLVDYVLDRTLELLEDIRSLALQTQARRRSFFGIARATITVLRKGVSAHNIRL